MPTINFSKILVEPIRRKKVKKKSNSSECSSISAKDLELIVDNLKGQQHRQSLRNNYYGIWHHFNSFFLRLDVKPLNWEKRIIIFVGHLINEGRKSMTIRCYLSAIRVVLKTEGIEINEDLYLLQALTRACKLKNDRIMNHLPIKRGMLKIIMKDLEKSSANNHT